MACDSAESWQRNWEDWTKADAVRIYEDTLKPGRDRVRFCLSQPPTSWWLEAGGAATGHRTRRVDLVRDMKAITRKLQNKIAAKDFKLLALALHAPTAVAKSRLAAPDPCAAPVHGCRAGRRADHWH